MKIRVVENLTKASDAVASKIRARLKEQNIYCLNLLGSPGSGKTALLEKSIPLLGEPRRVLVLEGDLATTRDAERILQTGAQAVQICTGRGCHLPAHLVEQTLEGQNLEEIEFLFIENVGNLVCPAGLDIGEHHKVTVISVTEGEDKPLKYPFVFEQSDLVIVAKTDLAPHLDFELSALLENVDRVHPGIRVIETSSKSGIGIEEWVEWVRGKA